MVSASKRDNLGLSGKQLGCLQSMQIGFRSRVCQANLLKAKSLTDFPGEKLLLGGSGADIQANVLNDIVQRRYDGRVGVSI